ncbi:hypothetical protein [Streptomyces sp. V3I7]|uniref:hypothetical protein n=1 Tax=Streptomyces sp. V3I7 TaxID=3042278 RepID=UPI00278726F1|nr:hypothetical protein [Streptomyces sp. V3I7]MDQ0991198.1 hypothetical protein [Streptomyces sp. V3I7]
METRPAPETDETAVPPAKASTAKFGAGRAARPGSLRDPWGESGGAVAAPAHDPHEVTVQLDAVRFGGGPRPAPGGGGQDGSDSPVFVDESGRRSRTFRRIGTAVGLACAAYGAVIVVTLLSGSSDAPWLPMPGQREGKPAGQVDISPLPAESDAPRGEDGAPSGTGPAASDGTTPSQGVGSTAPAARPRPGKPGSTTDVKLPAATAKPTSGSGASGGPSQGTQPSTAPTPSQTSAGPSRPAESPGTPSAPPAGGSAGPGGDPVAGSAASRRPVAAERHGKASTGLPREPTL